MKNKFSFIGNWTPENQKELKMIDGKLVIDIKEKDIQRTTNEFVTLWEKQKSYSKNYDLEITVDIHYKARSLKQNSTMWALYSILANEQNGGRIGKGCITMEQLYEADLIEYAPKGWIEVDKEMMYFVLNDYRVLEYEDLPSGKTKCYIMITSSKWKIDFFAKWLDMLFNRCAEIGIFETRDIGSYWQNWRKFLNDEEIVLNNDEEITGKEYKKLTPICEATGKYIGQGGGSLAHIKARGIGGHPEEEKDRPSNWLHLSDPAHALLDNGKGIEHFLKLYPHLDFKINNALGKIQSVKDKNIENITNLFEGETE